MSRAWPRFLPEPSTEAIAHALIIEAYAIVVEQLSDGLGSLSEAHDRALGFAESQYAAEAILAARAACAAAPENQTARLPLLCGVRRVEAEAVRNAA